MLSDKKKKILLRSVLTFLIFYYTPYLQYLFVYLFRMDVTKISNHTSVILSTVTSFITMVLLFIIYRKDLIKEFKIFKKNIPENFDIGLKYWLSGLAVMVISNLILSIVLKSGGAANENAVQTMISAFPLLMIIDAGIIAPFNEELVFRKSIKDMIKNKYLFAFISFLLFGGAHVMQSGLSLVQLLYIIPYGSLGAAFALAYYESDTVFTSMFIHMIHNIILVLASIFI